MQYDVSNNIMMFMNLTLFITCGNSPKPSVQGILPAKESKGVTRSYSNIKSLLWPQKKTEEIRQSLVTQGVLDQVPRA